jgi:hypothetical protein
MTTLKHHHIRLRTGPAGSPDEWEALLKKIKGVTEVRVDADRGDVYVEYDLGECCEEAIEKWMVQAGFVLYDSVMERLKRGWIHYTEENERDALSAEPHPCCDVDDKEGKKKELK